MQTKLPLLASALSLIGLISAQDKLSAMESYVSSATDNPAFISANRAVTDSLGVVASQAEGYFNSIQTATASVPLPSYVANLPPSAQGPLSSYYVGAADIITSGGTADPTDSMITSDSAASTASSGSGGTAAPTGSMTTSGSAASTASSGSANSTSASNSSSSNGSRTTPAPSQSSSSGSSGSTTATSSSASARASNGAVAQHPGTFIAAAAGALGFAILL